jgi:DNA-binding MarR family transcriptional regulator
MSLRDLKRATFLHPPAMTYVIDGLAKRGLLKRRPHPTDRRTICAVITAKGRRLADRATGALGTVHFGVSDLTADDALAVAELLSQMESD